MSDGFDDQDYEDLEAVISALRARVAQLEALLKGVNAETSAEIETLRARMAKLEALLKECSDELEEHVEARYARTKPHLERQYERDIEPVRQARAALKDTPQ